MVFCYPLKKIFKERNIQSVDLLIIDTEGHDYEVIQSIDFNFVKPKQIIYENKHLGNLNETCERLLTLKGYDVQKKMDRYVLFSEVKLIKINFNV